MRFNLDYIFTLNSSQVTDSAILTALLAPPTPPQKVIITFLGGV